jgi:dUTP diphosphatase
MSGTNTIGVFRLEHGRDLPLPRYETDLSAGVDLRAAVTVPVTLTPGQRQLIPTGLVIELPAGTEGQVRPRSGLALKHGVTCLNAPGTIDADYRGEVGVILINHGDVDFTVERGMRIAQLVVAPIVRVNIELRGETTATARGKGGFGSTGTK